MTKAKADMYIPDEDRRKELGKMTFLAKDGQIKLGRKRKMSNRPTVRGHARCKCEECGHYTLINVVLWDTPYGFSGNATPFSDYKRGRNMLENSTEPPIPEKYKKEIKDTDF